ncbi:thioredoxin family protein [Aquimarina gracilis]|uniref:Thioredoxin family protein n=1 Tax=Aquimarina gracilis TaxID=874422 RepID=A0ABU5ZXM2_9FLAO|nr:thioredoxin family protein [Aquimarina gracilis]MEB3346603.1 thioredoxin family protein [Aquimarina gracilis]
MNIRAPFIVMLFSVLFLNNLAAQDWKYDLDEALTLAKEKDQKVVLFFTGSDWCPPCIKLEKHVLSSDKFANFAQQKYVWLKADFPRRKKNRIPKEQKIKNKKLADRYNKKMIFPVILVLNKEGVVLGATGYRRDLDVEGYISLLRTFDTFGE